jgi:xanthine dehydrogenase YagT iron-sulfur-binding subunit
MNSQHKHPEIGMESLAHTIGEPSADANDVRSQTLYDAELTDTRGRRHRLSEFNGSPVVLVFHTREWDPSRSELVDAYNSVVSQVTVGGAHLLSITPDAPWHTLAFANDDAISLPLIISNARDLRDRFDVGDRASVIVLDGNGKECWRHTAMHTLPGPDVLARALDEIMTRAAGTPTPSSAMVWTRRQFVATILAVGVVLMLPPLGSIAEAGTPELEKDATPGSAVAITLDVNGRKIPLTVEPRVTLLDALREYAGLTGTKKGCDHGQCGACTVHIDDRRVLSCLTLAMMAQGKKVTTIEGLASGPATDSESLHPMQRAFIAHDGFQCGYCTPGQIMSATAVLKEPWGSSDDDVKEAMSGNICRCGAYPGIVAAIQEARGTTGSARSAR